MSRYVQVLILFLNFIPALINTQHKFIFFHFSVSISSFRRSQWPRGLRRRSAAAWLLGSRFRIPPVAWMFVSCDVPRWWKQYAPLKRRSTIILHGSTSQKTILNIILDALRTWNLTFVSCVYMLCCPVQVEASATDWSLVQRSPTVCLIICVIKKPQKGPYVPVGNYKKIISLFRF
jgi:hypothetical protein